MKYSVGYQQTDSGVLIDTVIQNKLNVNEVYFAYKNFANGRSNAINDNNDYLNRQLSDLKKLSNEDIPLNLLLNGNCYGVNSLLTAFYDDIYNTVSALVESVNLKCVTTTSPLIASFIKSIIKVKVACSSIGLLSYLEYCEITPEWVNYPLNVLYFVFLLFAVTGIIYVLQGKAKELPILNKFKIFK